MGQTSRSRIQPAQYAINSQCISSATVQKVKTAINACCDQTSLQGAEAPLSGLIAMLAAAEILGNNTLNAQYERRLVFAAFAGEPWGYMGSKRLLWELHTGEKSTKPLTLDAIDQVPCCARAAVLIEWVFVSSALFSVEAAQRETCCSTSFASLGQACPISQAFKAS